MFGLHRNAQLSEDLAPVDVHIDEQGHELQVTWSEEDGKRHKSSYSAEWLVAKATNVEAQRYASQTGEWCIDQAFIGLHHRRHLSQKGQTITVGSGEHHGTG